jgi:hypothetical protein
VEKLKNTMAGLKFQKTCYISDSDTDEAQETVYSGSGGYKDTDMEDSDQEFDPKTVNVLTRTSKRLETKQSNSHGKVPETIQRQPTRVPNPKVTNRNALLARENRKRKKELMDTLQQELDESQLANKKLKKALKSRDLKIQELEKQCAYFKSILANKTVIMEVIQSLNNGKMISSAPAQKIPAIKATSAANYTPPQSYTSSCSPHSTYSDDLDQDYGRVLENDPFLSDVFTDNSLFTDSDFAKIPQWDDTLISPMADIYQPAPQTSQDENKNDVSEPGVCVHVNGGKVSIEFCASCHFNSQKNWTTV